MSDNSFKVTVIIPFFNAAKYVKDAAESVLSLEEVGEVLMVDDGSQDDSFEICKKIENDFTKVRVLQHDDKGNHGPSASRNLGIKNSSCDYVSFLDADDYYLPCRFKSEKFIFENQPDVEVVYGCSYTIFITKDGEKKYYSYEQSNIYTLSDRVAPEKLFKALLFYSHGRLHTSAITIKKSAFVKTGLFNTKLKWAEDTELWLKLALKTKMVGGNIESPISLRRIHDNNIVHQTDKAQHFKIKMYQSLLNWSMKEKYPFMVVNDIFNAYKNYMSDKFPLISEKKLFWGLLKSNKSILGNSFFWKKLKLVYLRP